MNSSKFDPIELCFARIVPASYASDKYVETLKMSGYDMKNGEVHKYFLSVTSGSFGGTHKVIFHGSFPIEEYDTKINEIYTNAKKIGFDTEKNYNFSELQTLSKSLRKSMSPK